MVSVDKLGTYTFFSFFAGNEVVKKWRSVKDNFFRYVKKIKENSSSGSGAKQLKKYHYYNQLLFLMKVAQNKTDSSLEIMPEETERNENTTSSPFPTKKKTSLPPGPSRYVPASRKRSHQAIDDFEAQTLEALQEKENRHLSFFKGILPSLDGFTELQTLTFQSKVINIITEMRFGEQAVQSTPLQSRGYQTGQQYQATPLQSRGYLTGQHAQSPSPSSYQTDEFETTYSANATINNFTDDSQEEDYNFALLPNSNT